MLYHMLSYTHAPRARQGAHSARVSGLGPCRGEWRYKLYGRGRIRSHPVRPLGQPMRVGVSAACGAIAPPPGRGRPLPPPGGHPPYPLAGRGLWLPAAAPGLPPGSGRRSRPRKDRHWSPSWVAGAHSARRPTGGTARRRVPRGAGSLRLSPLLPRPYSVVGATVSRLSSGGDYAPCGARAIIGARAPWPLRGPLPGPS